MSMTNLLTTKAAEYEAAAEREINTGKMYGYDGEPCATEMRAMASLFMEALAKADTMTPDEFEDYGRRLITATYFLDGSMA